MELASLLLKYHSTYKQFAEIDLVELDNTVSYLQGLLESKSLTPTMQVRLTSAKTQLIRCKRLVEMINAEGESV